LFFIVIYFTQGSENVDLSFSANIQNIYDGNLVYIYTICIYTYTNTNKTSNYYKRVNALK